MSNLPIFTALSVPTVISHPSQRCLQWCEDGQICLVTKSAVHILTPDTGINFNTPADIKSPLEDEQSERPLGWFRTMIETAKVPGYNWSTICQGLLLSFCALYLLPYHLDWAALSLGSLDVAIRSVACSPSNVTSRGRCVLAVLNSNMEVSLWTTTKNHLKGEWMNIQDVTALLLDLLTQADEQILAKTLQAQVTSLAWSKQPDFGVSPAPAIDASILALGSRAGFLTFFKFNRDLNSVFQIRSLKVSDRWITQTAWSPWVTHSQGHCESILAYATDNGYIRLLKIVQNIQVVSNIGFSPQCTPTVSFDGSLDSVHAADGRGITALTWVDVSWDRPILVFGSPGLLHLWSQDIGHRVLQFQNQRLSSESSALSPVSGISHIPAQDMLIVALFDGSFHAVHHLRSDPSWNSQSSETSISSGALSEVSRMFFARATPGGIEHIDVNRINGMVSYDGLSTLVWIYEALRPSDFSYKHEARHEFMLLAAPMWQLGDETILRNAAVALGNIHCAPGSTPIFRLRSTFIHLCNSGRFVHIYPQILEMLQQSPAIDDTLSIVILPWTQGLVPEFNAQLRQSFVTHFFGWESLLSLRMKLSLADMCWKLSKTPEMQASCGQVAQFLLTAISQRVLRILMRHITALIAILAPADIPFVLRIVVQGLLPGSPPDLSSEAQQLSEAVNATIDIDPSVAALQEVCPACHVEVPLQDITRAMCSNGHTWGRCSVTSFILATSMVRTCIGCSRKAFLPISQGSSMDGDWLPVAAHSVIVRELLEAVQRCLFCGNSFVTIV
ncbi:transcription factor IIIC subunit delta N-term-domain-containing protein [Hygrophoropsis aurantiaca]|uniref:Transcription factor IIIC subunit delta N-term-domain-containing protein n=1 Tax=Hygrophoropsis aurantiaca TaxID=72124 RepID=A0ACB8AAS1_9AGAM|nr:transcription factor IIIC subunit delta N-term-domain-containing protein [Hygrophoropsis aurantiaca]